MKKHNLTLRYKDASVWGVDYEKRKIEVAIGGWLHTLDIEGDKLQYFTHNGSRYYLQNFIGAAFIGD